MVRSDRQAKAYQDWKAAKLRNPNFRRDFESGLDQLRLGASIAILRKRRHLSQAQLAKLAHTSQPVISRLERGENVELATVHRVAIALEVAVQFDLVPRRRSSQYRFSSESPTPKKAMRTSSTYHGIAQRFMVATRKQLSK